MAARIPMMLLDTCALLWLTLDQAGLPPSARALLARSSGQLLVSPITAFEIVQKHARGKLELSLPPTQWFPLALKLHGLREARFDASIALAASTLPDLHRDPFDRLLIATALVLDCPLLTPDPLIQQYSHITKAW